MYSLYFILYAFFLQYLIKVTADFIWDSSRWPPVFWTGCWQVQHFLFHKQEPDLIPVVKRRYANRIRNGTFTIPISKDASGPNKFFVPRNESEYPFGATALHSLTTPYYQTTSILYTAARTGMTIASGRQLKSLQIPSHLPFLTQMGQKDFLEQLSSQ